MTSKDGTRVPYFEIAPKGLQLDGKNRTLAYGYGGFEVSLLPHYSGSIGRAWLTRGGVYVIANTRGGGEYGPAWHKAALKANRPKAYEDFAAVAEDADGVGARPARSAEFVMTSDVGALRIALDHSWCERVRDARDSAVRNRAR